MGGRYSFEGGLSRPFLISQRKEANVADRWNKEHNDWDLGFRRGIMDKEFESWLLLVSMTLFDLRYGVDRAS